MLWDECAPRRAIVRGASQAYELTIAVSLMRVFSVSHWERAMAELIVSSEGLVELASEREGSPADVYEILAQHQRQEEWNRREMMEGLQTWANRFVVEFKLDIPEVVLCVDVLPSSRYGHFRNGHNGFGLKGEVAINARYLTPDIPLWEVLGTLLHELLHAWQQAHGTPGKRNHHNAEFRAKAFELGLIIDRRGLGGYAAESRFKDLLRGVGVVVPEHELLPPARRPRGESKLKKWSCGCTNVRVAVADFRAMCLKCGNEFRRDSAGSNSGEADVRSNNATSVNEVRLIPMTGFGHRPN
jgi:hypothetical protein